MIYYSNEARQSHIDNIDRLKHVLFAIPGNVINVNDSATIINYLSDYQKLIIKEMKETN